MAENQRAEILFSGHVQGVGFRFTAARIARNFAMTGYVKNLRDGRVELVAEGTAEEINAFVEAVGREMGRNISDIKRSWRPAKGEFTGFGISH